MNVLIGKNHFTSIDLKDGFFQVEIEKKDTEKTTLHTGSKLMQFTRMPHGLKMHQQYFKEG